MIVCVLYDLLQKSSSAFGFCIVLCSSVMLSMMCSGYAEVGKLKELFGDVMIRGWYKVSLQIKLFRD